MPRTREEKIAACKAWRTANPDKQRAYAKKYAAEKHDEIKLMAASYRARNRDRIKVNAKAYKESHKEEIKAATLAYVERNRDLIAAKEKAYRAAHRTEIQARLKPYMREYIKRRKAIDPQFKIKMDLSCQIYITLRKRGLSKNGHKWETMVGYTAQELREHLERQFTPEMTWENHGSYWHIDHIRPQSWFRYDTTECPEFKACWALSNLQPLDARTNRSKGNRREGK